MKFIICYVIAILFTLIMEIQWYNTVELIVTEQGEEFEGRYLIRGILIRSILPINILSMLAIYSLSKLNEEELINVIMDEYHQIIQLEKAKSGKK